MTEMGKAEAMASIIGASLATLFASFFSYTLLGYEQTPMVLASTGASAILIFALPHAPVSHPWKLVGGHVVSAAVGITCYKLFPHPVISSSLAIGLAMLFMLWLQCMHPPGGATAITAVIGGPAVHDLGYIFILIPVLINCVILLSIAIAVGTFRENNPFEVDNKEHHY
jgi:CBS domain-containing membrane protein